MAPQAEAAILHIRDPLPPARAHLNALARCTLLVNNSSPSLSIPINR